MKESYRERLAIHSGPQSCIVVRKSKDEALIGVQTGRAIELRNVGNFGEPMLSRQAEGHSGDSVWQEHFTPCAVKDPEHVWKHYL